MGSVPRAGRLRYLVVPDALTLSVAAVAADLLRGYIRSTASRLTRPGSKESTSLLGAEGPAGLSTAAQRVCLALDLPRYWPARSLATVDAAK